MNYCYKVSQELCPMFLQIIFFVVILRIERGIQFFFELWLLNSVNNEDLTMVVLCFPSRGVGAL